MKSLSKGWLVLLAVSWLGFSNSIQAELLNRGNGLIYDTVLDIIWLQDANYAFTSGYDDDGKMTWYEAVAWADQLSYQGFDDWRLASISVDAGIPTGVIETLTSIVNCYTELEEACRDNELGYMFVYNLGGWLGENLQGDQISVDGVELQDIQYGYWSNTAFLDYFDAFVFFFGGGGYFDTGKTTRWAAWAVRDGDVDDVQCVIPEDLIGFTVEVRRDTAYLSWNESEGATRYYIYRSIDRSDFVLLANIDETAYQEQLGSNWKTIEYYGVAVSTCGESAPSEIVQIQNKKGGGGRGPKS